MPNLTYEGKPVLGDVFATYVCIQATPSQRNWEVKCQRFRLDQVFTAMSGLDLSRPTRIVAYKDGPPLIGIRSWN